MHTSILTRFASVFLAILLITPDLLAASKVLIQAQHNSGSISPEFHSVIAENYPEDDTVNKENVKDHHAQEEAEDVPVNKKSHNSKISLADAIDFEVFSEEKTIISTRVSEKASVAIPEHITNVTRAAFAYGFEGDREKAYHIAIGINPRKIQTQEDLDKVKVYFLDREEDKWIEAMKLKNDLEKLRVEAMVPGGSDYFAGMISAPEMPEANALVPTSVSDLEPANPSAGMRIMQAPEVNKMGSANLNYPLWIPKGRNGMNPQLSVSYSSDGGAGWLGKGWNIANSSISVDAKWGVPTYDESLESEGYLLDGESLFQEGGFRPNHPNVDSRGDITPQPRSASTTRFFKRIQNAWVKIERKGSGPESYVWIVTDASNTKRFYGTMDGQAVHGNSVLRSAEDRPIATWFLTKVQDQWGNTIVYDYTRYSNSTANNVKNGGVGMHLASITYTGFNQTPGKYSVVFSAPRERTDGRVNMNFGFKVLDDRKLENIQVFYDRANNPNPLVEYEFTYKNSDSTHYQTVLTEIKENRGGTEFYKHTMQYYESPLVFDSSPTVLDVGKGTGYLESAPWYVRSILSPIYDNIVPSPISTSLTDGSSGHGSIGIGLSEKMFGVTISKNTSVNIGLSGSKSNTRVQKQMVDMNGDGISDILTNNGNRVFYTPINRSANGSLSLGAPRNVDLSHFSRTLSSSIGGKVEVVGPKASGPAQVGINYSRSKSHNLRRLVDYNADGFLDLLTTSSGGDKILFGGLNSREEYVFSGSSELTNNPVIKGASADVPEDKTGQKPMEVVKSWTAYKSGQINISGTASLGFVPDGTVEVAVEHNGAILAGGFQKVTKSAPQSFNINRSVNKGEIILFRARCEEDGQADLLSWDPHVQYTEGEFLDGQDVSWSASSSADAFTFSSENSASFSAERAFRVNNVFSNSSTLSDDVNLIIDVYVNGELEGTYSTTLNRGSSGNPGNNFAPFIKGNPGLTGYYSVPNTTAEDLVSVKFRAVSSSNVEWSAFDWLPIIEMEQLCDDPVEHLYPVPELVSYNHLDLAAPRFVFEELSLETPYQILPDITQNANEIRNVIYSEELPSGIVYMTLKSEGTLYQKIGIEFSDAGTLTLKNIDMNANLGPIDNSFSGSTTLSKTRFTGATDAFFMLLEPDMMFNLEFFAKGPYAEDMIRYIQSYLRGFNIYDPEDRVGEISTEQATYYYRSHSEINMDYRHWGVFGWSPLEGDENLAIPPSEIHFALESLAAGDPENYDLDGIEANPDQYNAEEFTFWEFQAIRGENAVRDLWAYQLEVINGPRNRDHYGLPGFNNGHFRLAGAVTPNIMGEIDLSGIDLTIPVATANPNYTANGITSKTKSHTLAVNAGVSIVSTSTNIPGSNTFYSRSLNSFQDLNGDGYPDILYEDDGIKGQFTVPSGGHKSPSNVGNISVLNKSTTLGFTASLAGTYSNESKSFGLTGSASANASFSKTRSALMDINGDGLPDSYEDNGGSDQTFRLGQGYGFEGNTFRAQGFIRNQSFGASAGASVMGAFVGSFSKWVKSISAGFNINIPGTYTDKLYFDFNGDGLMDYIDLYQTDDLYINTGTSFVHYNVGSSVIPINENINKSGSTGFAAQASLTLGPILAFIKIPISGGYSDNFAINRVKTSFMDMNGDGAPDYVHADGDQLKVYYAQFGKAQKLKRVTNPLGGSFVIDYKVEGNKRGYYEPQIKTHLSEENNERMLWDMPNAKWVMHSLVIDDGKDVEVSSQDLDGADQVSISFAYDGGIKLRRERDFVGFTRIATIQEDDYGILEDYFADEPNYDVEKPRSTAGWYSCPLQVDNYTMVIDRKRFNASVQDYQKPEGLNPTQLKKYLYQSNQLNHNYQFRIHEWTDSVQLRVNTDGMCMEFQDSIGLTFDLSYVELVSDESSDYELRLVETGHAGVEFRAGTGEVIKDDEDRWLLLENAFAPNEMPEVLTVFPAVTDQLNFSYPIAENRDGLHVQKYHIKYDARYNVVWYEDFGDLLRAQIEYIPIDTIDIGRWDTILQPNPCGSGTVIHSADNLTYKVVVACTDTSYSNDTIYGVNAYSSACGNFPGQGPLTICAAQSGEVPLTFQSMHLKWVTEQMIIKKAVDASTYTQRIIATMDYFDPANANNRTNALEVHKVWSQNTADPANMRRFTKVEALHQDKAIAQIGNYLSDDPSGTVALTDLDYDSYGNVTSITAPENLNNQRAVTDFTYDGDVHQFVTRIENAYAEFTCNIYDFGYQHLLQSTSINGHTMRYSYDGFQRLEHLWAPREFNNPSNGPSVSYSYAHDASTPVAYTYHNTGNKGFTVTNGAAGTSCGALTDISSWTTTMTDTVATATFTDGLNRVIQIQHQTDWDDPATTTDHTMAVKTRCSGFSAYDIFGNVISQTNDFLSVAGSFGTLQEVNTDVVAETSYDYLNRPVQKKTAYSGQSSGVDFNIQTIGRGWEDVNGTNRYFEEASDNLTSTKNYIDAKSRKIKVNQGGPNESTAFDYDELGQLIATTAPNGEATTYRYDFLGRNIEEDHPDRGITITTYDNAGNVTQVSSPGTEQEIANGFIAFDYNYNRLIEKMMPAGSSYEDMYNVSYTYGSRGDGKNGAGRIVNVEQGDPANPVLVEALKYDELGNVHQQVRTLDIPLAGVKTFTSDFWYDTFGRALRIDYPGQDRLDYQYSSKASLIAIETNTPCANVPHLIDEMSYDGYGNVVYMKYGNGSENSFGYHSITRGLLSSNVRAELQGSSTQQQLLGRQYQYNSLGMLSESELTPARPLLGVSPFANRRLETTYSYNSLLQLTGAETKVNGNTVYDVTTSFLPAGRVHTKSSSPTSGTPYVDSGLDYQSTITYSTSKPNQIDQVSQVLPNGTDNISYTYNLSGSVTDVSHDLNGNTAGSQEYLWNEEQMLVADRLDNSDVHYYVYDYQGERIMKTSYTYTSVWQNDNALSSSGDLNAYTVYVNPYIVKTYYSNEEKTTYHYYMNMQRVASGIFYNQLPAQEDPGPELPEGEGGNTAESQKTGTVVTDQLVDVLNAFGYVEGKDFERSDLEEPQSMEETYPEFASSNEEEGNFAEPEAAAEGTGGGASGALYCPGIQTEVYWYHPNYLGNVDLITDTYGKVHQFFLYTAWGESMHEYNAQTSGFDSPYRFNGKELDEETGNYYYGARYYDPQTSAWLSVDPLASEMPNWSPYSFNFNNPIFFVDPDGMKPTPSQAAAMAWHIYDAKQGDVVDGWTLTSVYTNSDNPGYKSGLYTREVDGVTEYTMVNMGTIPGTGKKNRDSMSENFEQPLGGSEHMKLSLDKARELDNTLGADADLTFVGHSKGGGEAAANAVATNRDAYVFNPAAVNLKAYGLDSKNYTANMIAFVVKGDPVSGTYPLLGAKPIDKLIMLPRQSWINPIENHNNFREALRQYLENNTIEE
jgi:RHS repeat-associated protein